MTIDPVEALRLHLMYGYPERFEGLGAMEFQGNRLVSGVYAPRIPAGVLATLKPCLQLRRDGPGRANAIAPLSLVNVETRAYAPPGGKMSDVWVNQISNAVYMELRYLKRGMFPHSNILAMHGESEAQPVMIFWAKLTGGPVDVSDPDYDYPCVFRSFQLMVADPELTV